MGESTIKVGGIIFSGNKQQHNYKILQVCHVFQHNGSSKKQPLPLIFGCALSNSCSVLYSLRVRTQLRLPIFQGTVGIVWYCLLGVM